MASQPQFKAIVPIAIAASIVLSGCAGHRTDMPFGGLSPYNPPLASKPPATSGFASENNVLPTSLSNDAGEAAFVVEDPFIASVELQNGDLVLAATIDSDVPFEGADVEIIERSAESKTVITTGRMDKDGNARIPLADEVMGKVLYAKVIVAGNKFGRSEEGFIVRGQNPDAEPLKLTLKDVFAKTKSAVIRAARAVSFR